MSFVSRKTVRAGIIGLGHRGRRHLRIINALDAVLPVWVYDPVVSESLGGGYNIPLLNSIQQIPDYGETNFAVVAVPHKEYMDTIRQCAEVGVKYFLKEKPVACSLNEAMELKILEDFYGLKIAVAAQRRHSKAVKQLRELITKVGVPLNFTYNYCLGLSLQDINLSDWRENRHDAGGGAVIDMGYHAIDLVTYLFGQPQNISCLLRKPISLSDVESGAVINLNYGDTCGTIYLERFAYPGQEELKLVWREFTITLDSEGLKCKSKNGDTLLVAFESSDELLTLQLKDFLDFVLNDSSDKVCRISNAINTISVVDRCYDAAKWMVINS